MTQAEAVQYFVAESHGSIIVHQSAPHLEREEVAKVIARLDVTSKDRETVKAASGNILAASSRGLSKACRGLVPMNPHRDAIEDADIWVWPPAIWNLGRARAGKP